MTERATLRMLFLLLALSVLSTVAVSADVFWGVTTSKALWLRASIFVTLPFYFKLLLESPKLRPDLRNPLNLAVIAFALVNVMAALFGVNWTRSFWGSYERMGGVFHLLHLTLLYFYLLMLANAEPQYLRILTRLLVWIAALSSVYGICEALGMGSWVPDIFLVRHHRISSIYGNPIFFASFLILPMALTLFCWLQSLARASRILFGALFTLQLLALFLTGTRGAVLGLGVGICLAGVLLILKRQTVSYRSAGLLLLAIPVLSIALLIAVSPSLLQVPAFQRIMQLQDASSRARLILWRIAWRGYTRRPFLGTGPENYYLVFYKEFDQKLYEYANPHTRYDKPHNQLLELLVTTGTAGFLAYCAMLILTVLALWKAYRAGRFSWSEFVVLVSGAVAYQVQNLFAFDTQAAMVAFYFYTGFAGTQWIRSVPYRNQNAAKSVQVPFILFCVVLAGMAYGAFIVYGSAADVIRQVNYAMKARQARVAIALFDGAARSPFTWDRRELATRYQEYVNRLSESDKTGTNEGLVNGALGNATAVLEQTTTRITNDPSLWLELASLYSQKSRFNGAPADPRAGAAIHRAMELAPNWIEPLNYLIQYEALCKHYGEATRVAERIVELFPESGEARWNLASVYKLQGEEELAIKTARIALDLGYRFRSGDEVAWVSDYYADKKDYDQLADVYEKALRSRPYDIRLYESLAATYSKLGAKQKAIAMAMKASQLEPSNERLRALVRSLQ